MGKSAPSAPSPDPQVGQAALMSAETGQDWLKFMQGQAKISNQWALEDRKRYQSVFQPLEDKFVKTAQNWDSPERQAKMAAEARADVMGASALQDQMRGPNLLLAGASNSVIYREETWAIDEAGRAGRDPKAERVVFRGVTTDATPTTLAPRLFVGEREMVRGRIRVAGRMYGAAATERFSTVLEFSAYRDAGGNITLSIAADDQHGARWDTTGAAAIVTTVETTAGMDAAVVVDTSAQTLGVQVTGKASTRIVWAAEVEGLVRISEDREYAA